MSSYPLLGISETAMAVVMDMIYDIHGKTNFTAYPNLEVDFQPQLEHLNNYSFQSKPVGTDPIINDKCFFATGTASIRKAIFEHFLEHYQINESFYDTLIHSRAYCSPSTKINSGVLVEPGAIISTQSNIDFGTYVKRGVLVGHHNNIGRFVDLNPGVILSGNISIGKSTTIGTGAVLKDNISIGSNSIIGIGSVVVKDIPDNVIAFGNPCKVVRPNT